ncbi:MAG: CPBP family intramembrane metalloprotease [Lachnospiraceae bacterium]|nr:CPBP family intramembrane metalloprotease [Lachnospiraceae bacterium]
MLESIKKQRNMWANKKQDSVWSFIWVCLAYLVFCNVMPALLGAAVGEKLPGSVNGYYTALCCLTGSVFIWYLYSIYGEKVKLSKNISFGGIVEALGVGLFLFFFINFFVSLLLGLVFTQSQANYGQAVDDMFQTPYSTFFQLVFMAPVFEELIFRGFLLRRALRWRSVAAAVVLTAGFFGLLHMSVVQGLSAMAAGVVLCLLFVWKRSIGLCILAHSFYNGLAFFMVLLSSGGGV